MVDMEVGPIRTRALLLHLAALLYDRNVALRKALDNALMADKVQMPGPAVPDWPPGGRDEENKDLEASSFDWGPTLLSALKQNWLQGMMAFLGLPDPTSASDSPSSDEGIPGQQVTNGDRRSPMVRASAMAGVLQGVLDLCSLCCSRSLTLSTSTAVRATNPSDHSLPSLEEGRLQAPPTRPEDVLLAICDGRLLSTAWLDQFGEQLPESIVYTFEAPQLTNAEYQFPEFFRLPIEVRGYEVLPC